MNIDKFKNHHVEIMSSITALRNLVKADAVKNAAAIADKIRAISALIKLHLAVEDSVLYPTMQKSADPGHVAMGNRYQSEMTGLAASYTDFARKWLSPRQIAGDVEDFRADANLVFKALHDRIKQENVELYPTLERI